MSFEPLIGSDRRRRGDDGVEGTGVPVMRGEERVLEVGPDDEFAGQRVGLGATDEPDQTCRR